MPKRRIRPTKPGCLPQPLQDSCNDRKLREQPAPFAEALTKESCFRDKGKPDLELLRKHLELEGAIDQNLMFELLEEAADLFDREPTMLRLEDPINIVGDIHGQFWDLMRMFEVGGHPGPQQYLFLGDYVDRGSFSIEVSAYLLACKVKYPSRVYMLRGNHECRQMTSYFNFREECEYKYDLSIYNAFMEVFDTLPLCATVNSKYFAVHGGISPQLVHLADLRSIDRIQEPPKEGLICDLIWSDPNEKDDNDNSKSVEAFAPNQTRGCSIVYSAAAAARFLKRNGMLSILRAHEAQSEGYKMHKVNPATGFPSVITIFSAPNYCDTYGNKAAIIRLDNSTLNVMQYNHAPHPYFLPNYMDVFGWSIPFVCEKVLDFAADVAVDEGEHPVLEEVTVRALRSLASALRLSDEVRARAALLELFPPIVCNDRSSPDQGRGEQSPNKKLSVELKNKIRAVGKMQKMLATCRETHEVILNSNGLCPGHRIPPDILGEVEATLNDQQGRFEYIQRADCINESRPELPDEEEMPMMMTKTLSVHKRRMRPDYVKPAADDYPLPLDCEEDA